MKKQKLSKKDKFLSPPPCPKSNFWKELPVDIWLPWKHLIQKNTHDMSY